MANKLYNWDHHSDQPHVIRDKTAKRKLYRRGLKGSFKTLICSLTLPLVGLLAIFHKTTKAGSRISSIGLCVNIDDPLAEKTTVDTETLHSMVHELGVSDLLIRLPLSDISQLDKHVRFIESFAKKKLLVSILQDRQHIEDHTLLCNNLRAIFTALDGICLTYQIGNAVNRRKWGFISLDEYFAFFGVAQKLRDKEFPHLKLLGASIIDFELPNFARSLYHFNPIKYDAVAALLYVDRRGAPENTQLGVSLLGKINWFCSIIKTSRKTNNELVITETNWPLTGTEPFAPAVGDCMVSEKLQTAYLVRYYLLVFASGKISMCYWHQLVAPGYGLVDNRNGEIRKRDAYYAFKTLLTLFDNAQVIAFTSDRSSKLYQLTVKTTKGMATAVWANGRTIDYPSSNAKAILNCKGETLATDTNAMIQVNDYPVYLLDYTVE
jgi:hypothetical protein